MRKIIVVGLGYSDEKALPLGTLGLLKKVKSVYLRTAKHPVVSWLISQGITYQSFDEVYESHNSFHCVYKEIVERLISLATHETVLYAVPGHPMVAEQVVQMLLAAEKEHNYEVDIQGGGSFLDIAFSRLRIDPIEGFMLLDGSDFSSEMLNTKMHILVGQVYSQMVASDVKLTLMERYCDDHVIQLVRALGMDKDEEILEIPLYELDRKKAYGNLCSVYVPPVKKGF